MGWGDKWEIPNDSMFVMTNKLIELNKQVKKDIEEITGIGKIQVIPPTEPENQYWSTGALIFEKMTKEEYTKVYEDAVLHGHGFMQDGKHISLKEIYNNAIPTHDPYTNPNAHIYYECKCGAILDPKTKSFAALNNYAIEKGWKIRFGEHGYTPYCVKCGEEVE